MPTLCLPFDLKEKSNETKAKVSILFRCIVDKKEKKQTSYISFLFCTFPHNSQYRKSVQKVSITSQFLFQRLIQSPKLIPLKISVEQHSDRDSLYK